MQDNFYARSTVLPLAITNTVTNPPHCYQGHTPSFPPHGTISDFLHPIAEGLDPDRGQPYKGHHDLRHAKRGQTYQEHRQRVNLHQGGALQAVT